MGRPYRTNPGGKRGRGRPKSGRIDEVEEDTGKLGCRNWLMAAQKFVVRSFRIEFALVAEGSILRDLGVSSLI